MIISTTVRGDKQERTFEWSCPECGKALNVTAHAKIENGYATTWRAHIPDLICEECRESPTKELY
jgi:hypothetical protein